MGYFYIVKLCLSNSVAQSEYILWKNENADGQALAKESVIEVLVSYFLPTTCIPKENQEMKPCSRGQALNLSECLKYKCCYSDTSNFGCFTPLNDVPAQMFRMFALGVSSMIILGFLPVCCCSFCWRR
ncbi:PREDICTED: fragile X mental retardation 1 neighbor protein [Chrysochloris asiatica]|uniref:Fragile X mental retardation 1 neighbor protein n=1 Tax=Chrysochloris asiatica TaxID=185453 RepID=A0A9B0WWG2_CHRAS|nr:PREDICTED: fragile X mental retardation 1 neighbor protein [Chrysochloris asiatica]